MSPDDIFAAQMWPWPDPALKRDAMGRVLFVNAAFLQIYGGQVDDWRGNVITGWPAPQAPGQPYRFETRLPSEAGEQVYDWMEYTLADGNAFAVARNVTYLFGTPDPEPGLDANPPVLATQQVEHPPQQTDFVQPDPPAQAPTLPAFAETPAISAPSSAVDVIAEAAVDGANIMSDAGADAAFDAASYNDLATPETQPVEAQPQTVAPVAPAPMVQEPVAQDPVPQTPVPQTPVPQAPADDSRDFERRALPIEDDSAVLGNNWRDAVIAKAVGAEAPQEDEPVETVAPSEQSLQNAAETGNNGPIKILLAEDNAINALLTRTLLEAEGHAVDTVEDGALAVEAMKNAKYDLIFMDMRMPNMDGLEATRKIRAMDNVSKGLPIIALTANAFDDDRNACFDSGMNDFMTKPVSAEELSEMVRTWTQNKAERDAA